VLRVEVKEDVGHLVNVDGTVMLGVLGDLPTCLPVYNLHLQAWASGENNNKRGTQDVPISACALSHCRHRAGLGAHTPRRVGA